MSKLPLCAELVAIPGHVYVCVAGGGGGSVYLVWNVYQALREPCRGMAWKNCLHDHPVSTLHHTSQAGLQEVEMRSLYQHFLIN